MFIIYNFALILLSVVFLPVILVAFWVKPKLRAGFWQKLGVYNLKLDKSKPTLFFHAVSVGEVNAIEALVKKTREEFKEHNIVLSTVTRTGQEVANKKLKDTCDAIIYFPYDFEFSVKSFVRAVSPQKIIIAETEIWPGFVNTVSKFNIPVYIVNGRISPNSHNGYKKIGFFISKVLNKYTKILMQTEADTQRIISIGAKPEIVSTMGNLKFDIKKNLTDAEIENLKNEIKLEDSPLLIAGSTHSGEDEIVIESFTELKKEFPKLKLMIAPRHPERYESVQELIKKSGLKHGKRSTKDTFENNEIIMLDTMGELFKFYSACDIAFIGGSFVKTGGHNPLEAAIWQKPTISGPSVFNFKDIYAILTSLNASKIVDSEKELTKTTKKLLSDKTLYSAMKSNTKKAFELNNGALDFVITTLKN